MKADLDTLLSLLRLILGSRLGLRRDVVLGTLQEGVSVACSVAAPFLLKGVVDRLTHPSPWTALLGVQVVIFVAAWSAGGLFGGTKLVNSARIIEGVLADLSAGALRHQLPRIADGAIDAQRVFTALERLPYSLQVVVDGVLWRMAPLAGQLVASVAAVALLTPRYAALLCGFLVIYGLLADRVGRTCRQRADVAFTTSSALSRTVGDLLGNARRVVFNGAVPFEVDRFAGLSAERQAAGARLARSVADLASLQFIALLVGQGLVLVLAARDVAAGRLSLGVFVLLQAFAFRLTAPLGGVGVLLKDSVSALANLREMFKLQGAASQRPQGREISAPYGLTVKNLAFAYADVQGGLHAISFTLQPGVLAALVGPNGSGKSTLARILSGQSTPDAGQVLIGDIPLTELARERRHSLIHYVPQFIGLFNRSLRDNGLYPPTTTTKAEMTDRLQSWRFTDSGAAIDLEQTVGEQGARLSGGQIQKLELARLCGVQAPVLILDESTSALDPVSEQQIIGDLRQSRPDTTLVLITHRQALARTADIVLFLKAGRLVDTGSHAELLDRCEDYRRYWSGRTRVRP